MKLTSIICLLCVALAASCSDTSAAARPNVLMICLDTVRADRLGCYGYERNATTPSLDLLADRSLVFHDTSATAGWTKPSVPSFMTGTYPMQHGVYEGSARAQTGKVSDVLPEAAETLAEVFAGRNYQTGAIIENAQLRLGNGFEQGFGSYDDRGGSATEIRGKALDWIEGRDSDKPFFLYLHFLDAHWPFDVPDEYASLFADQTAVSIFQGSESRVLRDAINHGRRRLDDDELASLNGLYDGAIRYIDDELGLLFRELEAAGLAENTVICVIADHGEEFLEHGRVGHGHGLWNNLLSVPWIMSVPDREPQEVDVPVSLVDLFPTLLAAAGILAPETHSGIDRIDTPFAVRPVLAEHKEPRAYVQSMRSGDRKLVLRALPLRLGEAARVVADGEAWEIKFARTATGELHAIELQPGDAEGSEFEVKARVTVRTGQELSLDGIPVRLLPETAYYGQIDSADDLAVGTAVKVKGHFENGMLIARRVKGYEASLKFENEIRGRVDSSRLTKGVGQITMGALTIEVDDESDWDLPKPYLKREALTSFVESQDGEFELERTLFDVAADSAELHASDFGDANLERELRQLFVELARTRLWSQADRRALDEEAIADLRGLGYVK